MNKDGIYPQFVTIPDKKIAYLVMRKCACSSIKHAIAKCRGESSVAMDGTSVHSKSEFEIFAYEFPKDQDWFTFTFVRDPILRFLSFYSNKILDQNLNENNTLKQYDRFGFLPHMTLNQAIDHLITENFETEPHVASQAKTLEAVGFDLSFVGRLEELPIGLNAIAERTNLQVPIRHLNRGLNRALIPSEQQFSRLAHYYRKDIERFGYSANYDSWYEFHIAGKEPELSLEYGYTFENEAKLINHSATMHDDGVAIHLNWRVHARQFRKRVVRVMRKTGDELELIVHLPAEKNLSAKADERWVVSDEIFVPAKHFRRDEDYSNVFLEVFFSDENKQRANLIDHVGHKNLLLLGLEF